VLDVAGLTMAERVEALRLQRAALEDLGLWEEALATASTAADAAAAHGGSTVRAAALERGELLARMGLFDDAMPDAEAALGASDEDHDEIHARAMVLSAMIFAHHGELAKADLVCQEAATVMLPAGASPYSAARFPAWVRRKLIHASICELGRRPLRAAYLLEGVLVDSDVAVSPHGGATETERAEVARYVRANRHQWEAQLGRVYGVIDTHAGGERFLKQSVVIDHYGDAERLLQEALAVSRARRDNKTALDIILALGFRCMRQGDAVSARSHLLEAAELYDAEVGALGVNEFRAALRPSRESLFALGIAACISVGDAEGWWWFMERARARLLYQQLTGAGLSALASNAERQEELEEVDEDLKRMRRRLDSDRVLERSPLVDELSAAVERKERLVRELLRATPTQRGLGSDAVPELHELSTRLPARTALVEYFAGPDELSAMLIANGDVVTGMRVRMAREEVEHYVQALVSLVSTPPETRMEVADDQLRISDQRGRSHAAGRLGAILHKALIAPFAEILTEIDDLVIVPYGGLHRLPFVLLGDERLLIEDHRITYQPSASVMLASSMGDAGDALPGNVAVFANPLAGFAGLELPFTEAEADAIQTVTGAAVARGGHATVAAFLDACGRYDTLHIATHATFDESRPLLSAVMLAGTDNQGDSTADPLAVYRLYGLRLRARLIVLSACQTSTSDLRPGEELEGLVRGFLAAGARSVVGTLWRIDDEATSALMGRFYELLGAKRSVGDALRDAQLELRGTEWYSDPYYWSPYVLHGA
jgi:CHAT domain-containing protein